MMDEAAAVRFLSASRSRFVLTALDWLTTGEDPVDVLFLLSREVGQALGPWDTYRLCALLGLGRSPSVRELGLDVLAEPVSRPRFAPVSEAFALAHARVALPEEEAPWAGKVRAALLESPAGAAPPAAIAAAAWALAGQDPTIEDGTLQAAAEASAQALQGPFGPRAAAEGLEALLLVGARAPISAVEAVGKIAAASQQADGGLSAPSDAPRLRELATLRALCAVSALGSGRGRA